MLLFGCDLNGKGIEGKKKTMSTEAAFVVFNYMELRVQTFGWPNGANTQIIAANFGRNEKKISKNNNVEKERSCRKKLEEEMLCDIFRSSRKGRVLSF